MFLICSAISRASSNSSFFLFLLRFYLMENIFFNNFIQCQARLSLSPLTMIESSWCQKSHHDKTFYFLLICRSSMFFQSTPAEVGASISRTFSPKWSTVSFIRGLLSSDRALTLVPKILALPGVQCSFKAWTMAPLLRAWNGSIQWRRWGSDAWARQLSFVVSHSTQSCPVFVGFPSHFNNFY